MYAKMWRCHPFATLFLKIGLKFKNRTEHIEHLCFQSYFLIILVDYDVLVLVIRSNSSTDCSLIFSVSCT